MASTWNGTLGFGMLVIPISLHTSVRDQDPSFKQLCPRHRRPISMRKICAGPLDGPQEAAALDPASPLARLISFGQEHELAPELFTFLRAQATSTEHEVAHADLLSGYPHPKETGKFIALSKTDFENAGKPLGRSFDIMFCTPTAAVDLRFFDKPYFMLPQKPEANRPYALLREALRQTESVAIGMITMRSKQHVAAVRVMGDALLLHLMEWPRNLVPIDEFTFPATELTEDEIAMGAKLVDAMTAALEDADLHDEYADNVQRLIAARVDGKEEEFTSAEEPAAVPVTDLLAMLRTSIDSRKAA
jgi:DNA end-binding protein Ku